MHEKMAGSYEVQLGFLSELCTTQVRFYRCRQLIVMVTEELAYYVSGYVQGYKVSQRRGRDESVTSKIIRPKMYKGRNCGSWDKKKFSPWTGHRNYGHFSKNVRGLLCSYSES